MKKIFISHSSKDKDILNPFVEFMKNLGLRNKEIIYTSNRSYGIPLGENIYDYLKNSLNSDDVIILFALSKNYYDSVITLNEMGAAWVKSIKHYNLLLPGFKYEDIKGTISSSEISFKIDDKEGINEFKDILINEFNLEKNCKEIDDIRIEQLVKNIQKLSGGEKKSYHIENWQKEVKDIITREELYGSKRFKDQQYIIEILEKYVEIDKDEEGVNNIIIDRSEVKNYIITDKGKDLLAQYIIDNNPIDELIERDMEIQQFLAYSNKQRNIQEKRIIKNVPFRWASGGVLPIIEYRNKEYVTFFYRDKAPFGWNIPLGASQCNFDEETMNLRELDSPIDFIMREFEEEFLVLDSIPKKQSKVFYHGFIHSHGNKRYSDAHIKLRECYDDIVLEEGKPILCEELNTSMNLIIKNGDKKPVKYIDNILAAFNFLEGGIEIVKVIKIKLPQYSYLLDGEILDVFNRNGEIQSELVRMPVALISCKYLESVFKEDISINQYTKEKQGNIKIKESIPEEAMILFNYDLMERNKVIKGLKKNYGIKEKERYQRSFETYFNNEDNTIKKEYTKFFTPATAKILNMYFNDTKNRQKI